MSSVMCEILWPLSRKLLTDIPWLLELSTSPGKKNHRALNYSESWRERVVERSCGASGQYEDGDHWITQNTLSLRSAENVYIPLRTREFLLPLKRKDCPSVMKYDSTRKHLWHILLAPLCLTKYNLCSLLNWPPTFVLLSVLFIFFVVECY
jgi:hypothetical protein